MTVGKAPLRHFAKHLFLISRVYGERNKAKENVAVHLKRMRKSIIKMRLSYTDIDRLKEKIDKLIGWERKYAKFFKTEDDETQELKNQIEEKQRMIEEKNEKIRQLTDSLSNIKSQTRHLFMEKAKRHHRLRALEQKIHEKVDVHGYYGK